MRTINGIELDAFTVAYVTCALWSSMDNYNDQGGESLDRNYTAADIDPKTLQSMRDDCAAFQTDNAELLSKSGLSAEQSGHDFWLTRNGHGAGFWDRGIGKVGRELSDLCKPYGSVNLYVGDDKKIHGE